MTLKEWIYPKNLQQETMSSPGVVDSTFYWSGAHPFMFCVFVVKCCINGGITLSVEKLTAQWTCIQHSFQCPFICKLPFFCTVPWAACPYINPSTTSAISCLIGSLHLILVGHTLLPCPDFHHLPLHCLLHSLDVPGARLGRCHNVVTVGVYDFALPF